MAQPKKEIEVRLVSVKMESSAKLPKKTNNVFVCRMPWLRTGIELRDGSQKLKLESGKWSAEKRPWHERILLKETVQGTFSVVAVLSNPVTDSAFAKFTGNAAYYVVKALASLADKAFPAGALGDFASGPLEALAKSVTDAPGVKDGFAGSAEFSSADLPPSGETMTLEIPLLAVDNVVDFSERTTKGSSRTVRKTILKAGERAGTCVVELEVL